MSSPLIPNTNNINNNSHLIPIETPQPLKPSPPTHKEIFKNFMGKEYNSMSGNAIEHVIYNLFKNCKKANENSDFDCKIKDLHPLNQLAILTHAHNIAKAHDQNEIAEQLLKKIGVIEEIITLAPPATFDAKLEDKSIYTTLKIVGMVILSGLAAIGLKSVFEGLSSTSLTSGCFPMNNNNVELLLQAGKGNVTAYDSLISIPNWQLPLGTIKSYHLRGIQNEKLLALGEKTFKSSFISTIEKIRYKIEYADYGKPLRLDDQNLISEFNQINKNSLHEIVLNEFENDPVKFACFSKFHKEGLRYLIERLTPSAIKGGYNSMAILEKINQESPILDFNKTLDAYAKVNEREAAERKNAIATHTPRAMSGDAYAMNELEDIHEQFPISDIDQIRTTYNEANAAKIAKVNEIKSAERENNIKENTENALRSGSAFWMNRLRKLNEESPIKNYDETLKLFIEIYSKNNCLELFSKKALEGSESDMDKLEQYNFVVPIPNIAEIREKFNVVRRRINIEQYTTDARSGHKLSFIKLKELHEESPIKDFDITRELYEKARSQIDNS